MLCPRPEGATLAAALRDAVLLSLPHIRPTPLRSAVFVVVPVRVVAWIE
jgi:hypothetical protein